MAEKIDYNVEGLPLLLSLRNLFSYSQMVIDTVEAYIPFLKDINTTSEKEIDENIVKKSNIIIATGINNAYKDWKNIVENVVLTEYEKMIKVPMLDYAISLKHCSGKSFYESYVQNILTLDEYYKKMLKTIMNLEKLVLKETNLNKNKYTREYYMDIQKYLHAVTTYLNSMTELVEKYSNDTLELDTGEHNDA